MPNNATLRVDKASNSTNITSFCQLPPSEAEEMGELKPNVKFYHYKTARLSVPIDREKERQLV